VSSSICAHARQDGKDWSDLDLSEPPPENAPGAYLMAGQLSELDRLQLQSRVWEPAGVRLLEELGEGNGKRVVDVGCGCLGWLRLLSRWVGPTGRCVGTDISDDLLGSAASFIRAEALTNVELVHDDLFDSRLPAESFDVVHARFQLAPLGRFEEQISALARLVAPGGVLVLEDPDTSSWGFSPEAPHATRLIALILQAFKAAGGDFDAGRIEFDLVRAAGLRPALRADIVALGPGHPYLRLPLQFAASLRPQLRQHISETDLDALLASVEGELSDPTRRGLSFTLVQTWATRRDGTEDQLGSARDESALRRPA
jgi:SAM-dependent methyltransferase